MTNARLDLSKMGLVALAQPELVNIDGGGFDWEWLAKEAISHFGDITDGIAAGWKAATS